MFPCAVQCVLPVLLLERNKQDDELDVEKHGYRNTGSYFSNWPRRICKQILTTKTKFNETSTQCSVSRNTLPKVLFTVTSKDRELRVTKKDL